MTTVLDTIEVPTSERARVLQEMFAERAQALELSAKQDERLEGLAGIILEESAGHSGLEAAKLLELLPSVEDDEIRLSKPHLPKTRQRLWNALLVDWKYLYHDVVKEKRLAELLLQLPDYECNKMLSNLFETTVRECFAACEDATKLLRLVSYAGMESNRVVVRKAMQTLSGNLLPNEVMAFAVKCVLGTCFDHIFMHQHGSEVGAAISYMRILVESSKNLHFTEDASWPSGMRWRKERTELADRRGLRFVWSIAADHLEGMSGLDRVVPPIREWFTAQEKRLRQRADPHLPSGTTIVFLGNLYQVELPEGLDSVQPLIRIPHEFVL